MEEVRLRELSERVVNEAKNMNVISDHTNISVASRVVEDYDANGRRILNYEVSFTYDVAPGFSAQEDFPSGKYHVEQSGAASSPCTTTASPKPPYTPKCWPRSAPSAPPAMPELTDTDARRLRSMLLDLDPLLFKGAIYYSSTGDDAAMKLCAITAVDTRLRPDMASLPFTPQPQLWPELLYCAALGLPAVVSAGMPESVAYDDRQPTRGNAAKTPGFNEFASPLVQRRFADWAKRGEFEELRDYDRRMNEQGYDEYRRLCDEAAEEYIGIYGGRLRLSDLTLHPYDVDDETYIITSGMGPVVVSVPKKKKEAEAFKASWPTMKFRNPRFIVKDDRVRIASVTLETSYGKSYPYSMENLATYRCPDVAVDFRSIIDRSKALEGNTAQGVPSVRQNTAVVRAKSSVDENIPVTNVSTNTP